jgi:RNA polymerase sigma factor (sigma-70 family)
MSPLSVRRYRAERLLREDFVQLRAGVLAVVRARLAARGVHIDASDLDACYASAWQALYGRIVEGGEIDAPAAWLTLVTFRRALDEHRSSRGRTDIGELADAAAPERDLAADLDDRARIGELVEALRGRLDAREREAAALCYVHGLSRAQAAEHMGISERRMRKLMDGRGAGRPGVATKVAALVRTVGSGGWCEEQRSLMRALALGVLDPEGERYRLASAHRRRCPACRAYVLSLRGLAAALPAPLLPQVLAAGRAALPALAGSASARAGIAAGHGAAPAAGGAAAGAGAGTGAGAGAGTGAGAGAGAGGGWLFAGAPLAGKLAIACVVALGIGAGCAALVPGGRRGHVARAAGERPPAQAHSAAGRPQPVAVKVAAATAPRSAASGRRGGRDTGARSQRAAPAGAAAEFGPERAAGEGSAGAPAQAVAVAAASGPGAAAPAPRRPVVAVAPAAGAVAAAEREFGPG